MVVLLAACQPGEQSVQEVVQGDPVEVEGGAEEEQAEADAHAGEVIVSLGEAGEFPTGESTFSVQVDEVTVEESPLTYEDPSGLFATQTFTAEQGSFVAVAVEATNTGTGPSYFYRFPELVTAEGITYGDSGDASAAATNYRLDAPDGGEVNPGASIRDAYVFDVPPDAVPDTLALESASDGTTVFLALR